MTDHLALVLDADAARCAATVTADVAALATFLAPELVYVHSNGVVDDRESYLTKVGSGAFTYDSLVHTVTQSRTLSNTVAVLLGDMHAVGHMGERKITLNSRTLSVWQADGEGRWQLAALQSSAAT